MRALLSAIPGFWLAAAASAAAQPAPAPDPFPPEVRQPTIEESREIDAGWRKVNFANASGFPENSIKAIEEIAPLVARTYGPRHPIRFMLDRIQGESLARLGKHLEAEKLLAGNVADFEQRIGPDKGHTLTARWNRASNLIQLGRLAEAAALYEFNDRIVRGQAGLTPLDLAVADLELAYLRRVQGRFPEAEKLARTALDARLAAPERDSAGIALARAALARALTGSGQIADAIALAEAGLGEHAREDVARARLLFAYGEALSEIGRAQDAQKNFRDSAALSMKIEGYKSPVTLHTTMRHRTEAAKQVSALTSAGSLLSDGLPLIVEIFECKAVPSSLGAVDEALQVASLTVSARDKRVCLEKARDFMVAGHGEDAPATLHVRERLASLVETMGDTEPALSQARALLAARERVNGRDHPATARAALVASRALASLGRNEEARAFNLRAANVIPVEAHVQEAERLDTINQHRAAAAEWQRAAEAFRARPSQDVQTVVALFAGDVFNRHYQGECADASYKDIDAVVAMPAFVLLGEKKRALDEAHAILLACRGKWDEAAAKYFTLSNEGIGESIAFQDARLARLEARRAKAFLKNPQMFDTALRSAEQAAFIARERRYTPDRDAKGKPLGFRREGAASGSDPLAIAFATQVEVDWALDGKTIAYRGAYQEQGTGKIVDNSYKQVHQGFDSAFRAAQDYAQSQAAASLLQTAARAAIADPELGRLIDRQEAAARRITDLDRNAAIVSGQSSFSASMQQDRAELEALTNEIRQKFPAYANTARPFGLSVEETRKRLKPGEAVLLIQPVGTEVYSFGVSASAFKWTKAKIGRAEIDRLVASVRCRIDTKSCRLDLPGDRLFESEAAAMLYRELIAPVASGFGDAATLYTVTGGSLGSIPLGILVTGDPALAAEDQVAELEGLKKTKWLADAYALATLPSVSSLRAYQGARERLASASFSGVGDPVLGPPVEATRGMTRASATVLRNAGGLAEPAALRTLSSLPGTRRELTAIASSLGAPAERLMLGAAAREGWVKTSAALASARIIAFATHAMLPGEFEGAAEPGLVFTPPDKPSAQDDGYLTATEAAALKLDADWVLLSACNTAGPAEGGSNESLSGLARAFLFAGARSLLVSHWPVEDSAGAAITSETFRIAAARPEISRAEALRQALRGIRSGQSVLGGAIPGWKPAWADPWAWAPFSLVESGS